MVETEIVPPDHQGYFDTQFQAEPSPPPWWKRLFGPLAVAGLLVLKLGAKLKFVIAPVLKFLPAILKTGSTMIITIGIYASMWGWKYAVGFVLLILVHELGHVIAAKKHNIPVSAPMFIPFMGAFIAMQEAPKNAVVEAEIGIAGPEWGTFGAIVCHAIGIYWNLPLFVALAWTAYYLNLFNLIPIGQLDGGHVVQAISPWLWLPGFVIALYFGITRPHFLIWLIILAGIPRVLSLFRPKTDEHKAFHDIPALQRVRFAVEYFGLMAVLLYFMEAAHQALEHLR